MVEVTDDVTTGDVIDLTQNNAIENVEKDPAIMVEIATVPLAIEWAKENYYGEVPHPDTFTFRFNLIYSSKSFDQCIMVLYY